jgi:cephalosporin hydroxylase
MNKITLDEIKALISKATIDPISDDKFLHQVWIDNTCARRPYYKFNQLLAKYTQPELIVELGIDRGYSCGHFAFGCPTAKIYGIDVHKDEEYPSKVCREVERNFPNFKYLRGWTWDKVADIAALNKPIDILFIDSWHEYDYLAKDWNDYHKMLRKGSLVIVDDLHMSGLGNVFDKIPGEKFVDRTMNPAVPFGIVIYDGTELILPYVKREYMP